MSSGNENRANIQRLEKETRASTSQAKARKRPRLARHFLFARDSLFAR